MKTCKLCGARKRAPAFPTRELVCRHCFRARALAQIEQSRRWIDEYARKWRRSAGRTVERAVALTRRIPDVRITPDRPPTQYHWVRHQAIMAYGGYRCACCGETEPMFLTLDHVNNGGTRHRRRVSNIKIFFSLRRRGYPPGFQVLCSNCNHGRHRNGGECPHKTRKKRPARRQTVGVRAK